MSAGCTPTTAAPPGTAARTCAVWSILFRCRPPTLATWSIRPCDVRATARQSSPRCWRPPQLTHVSLFVAGVEPANIGSISCLLKNGFQPLDPAPDWGKARSITPGKGRRLQAAVRKVNHLPSPDASMSTEREGWCPHRSASLGSRRRGSAPKVSSPSTCRASSARCSSASWVSWRCSSSSLARSPGSCNSLCWLSPSPWFSARRASCTCSSPPATAPSSPVRAGVLDHQGQQHRSNVTIGCRTVPNDYRM